MPSARKTKRPQQDTSHYFIDGYSPRKGLLGIVAYPNRLRGTDTEFTTFYMTLDGEWGHEPFEFDGRSVTYVGPPRRGTWWVLGKRGEVARYKPDEPVQFEQIPGAGTGPGSNGYLNRIALIGKTLYVCGYQRQVLVRDDRGWQRLDAGLLEPEGPNETSLEAMDGVAEDCIYAVGWKGQVWKFDGNSWRRCATPTNVDLHEVKCLDRDRVVAVGQKGTVLLGADDSWTLVADPDFDEDLWGVESFNDEIYVAGYAGLARIQGGAVVPVDTGLGRTVLGYRLRSKDGLLWSIGNDDILVFDGKSWQEIVCPDNVP